MIVNSVNYFHASKRCLSKEISSPYLWMSSSRRCHQVARAKKVLGLALFYPGNNDEHMARLLKCLAQFKSIYLWIDNAKSQTGKQVKTTFGRKAPFSELMILTPKQNVPSLNVCFSGKFKDFANQWKLSNPLKRNKECISEGYCKVWICTFSFLMCIIAKIAQRLIYSVESIGWGDAYKFKLKV